MKKMVYVLFALLLTALAVSCASTGEYMPLEEGDVVIGTVQANFAVPSTSIVFSKGKVALNQQSYIKLLETAEQKYPTSNIDIRDIIWVTGEKTKDNLNTKIFVTGKVIRIGSEDETPVE
ncbi:MAG: hypothetical protein LBI04_11170 [Treponema sp.]|jgi:hypothetical protein|nr:hypothetical protein [Treponema sp.]